MNTLLQTAVSTWETHNRNNIASALIVDGLVAMQQGEDSVGSTDAFEVNPVENQPKHPNKDNVLSALFESLSKTLKASA